MIDPTTYGLGVLFAGWLDLAGWFLFLYGIALVIGGIVAIVVIIVQWGGVTLGPDPVIPTAPQPQPVTIASPPAAPNYRRPDSDTGVVARIPGATPEAGPVCPTDETEVTVGLAPQYAALDRFFNAVDEATRETDAAMLQLVDKLADRLPDDDCPLTTQEIPPLLDAPLYDAAIRNTDTRELSEVMKKVTAP